MTTLTNDALTTLGTVKDELGITDASSDETLKRLINAVSRRIRSYCRRTFYYEVDIVEQFAGYGSTNLLLSRMPVISVDSITYDSMAVDSDDYSIGDAAAGILYRPTGWAWTAKLQRNAAAADPLPGTEEKLFEVTYTGGWITPQQAADDAKLGVPLGWVRSLPEDLEDACILAVTSRYGMRGQDITVKSERSLNYSATYGDRDLPLPVKEMLAPYRELL